MDKTIHLFSKENAIPKEVVKDLNLEGRNSGGRDSPESGSLYSDYESGQQYEDKDLPSGYNSGEQYDTLSTGYISGETYELPETRAEPLEPTLACIDEVSVRSDEDMFTLAMPPGFPDNTILGQTEIVESSSSSSINEGTGPEVAVNIGDHKVKRKKTVSYHASVPIEKSPLGRGEDIRYTNIPSDTDTTSCFDSDGAYMRSEGQSSDSGAALLQHSSKGHRKKGKDRKTNESNVIGGGKKRLKKAKQIIRNHEDFFEMYDNKHWARARKICFWFSVVSIITSIVCSTVLIIVMPRSCDPSVEWWQGTVIFDVVPENTADDNPKIKVNELIENLPKMKEMGLQSIKLKNVYCRISGNNQMDAMVTCAEWFKLSDDDINEKFVKSRFDDFSVFTDLVSKVHEEGMQVLVEIPAFGNDNATRMTFDLEQAVTESIVFWGGLGVDGISLVGLEQFAMDPYLENNVETWKSKFNQYGVSSSTKVMTTSYLLPHEIEATDLEKSLDDDEETKSSRVIADFSLLDATLDINDNISTVVKHVETVAKWDASFSRPWINWNLQTQNRTEPFTNADIAFQMILPGTINIDKTMHNLSSLDNGNQLLISRLTKIRKSSVPIFMNGNFKTCHGHCDGITEKEKNFKLHNIGDLLLLERHFSRRNRYMVIANLGSKNVSLSEVSSLYSGGELILDTSDLNKEPEFVKFKETDLETKQAYVIKFPK